MKNPALLQASSLGRLLSVTRSGETEFRKRERPSQTKAAFLFCDWPSSKSSRAKLREREHDSPSGWRLFRRIFLIPGRWAFYPGPTCTGNVAPKSRSVPLRFVITDQMVFCVVNPLLRDDEKTTMHLRNADVLSPADLCRVFRKPPSQVALGGRLPDVTSIPHG